MRRKKIKLVIDKRYLNPYTEKYFEVQAIGIPPAKNSFDRTTQEKVKIQYDGEDPKWVSFDILQPLVQKTLMDGKISGIDCACNLGNDNFQMFVDDLKRSGANIGNKSDQLMKRLYDNYKKDIPKEWRKSENEWIYRESPKSKGHLLKKWYLSLIDSAGEQEIEKNPANNSDNGIEVYSRSEGHDGVIGDRKKSIRMSCKYDKTFTFFQIRQKQNFDDMVFIFVYPKHIEVYEVEKKTFIGYLTVNQDQIIWAGGKEKRMDIESRIERNDLFHWKCVAPADQKLLEMAGFVRVL